MSQMQGEMRTFCELGGGLSINEANAIGKIWGDIKTKDRTGWRCNVDAPAPSKGYKTLSRM